MKCDPWQRRLERSRRKAVKLESQQPTKKRNALNAAKPGIFESIAGTTMEEVMETIIQPEEAGQHASYAVERDIKLPIVGRIQTILPSVPKATNPNSQSRKQRKSWMPTKLNYLYLDYEEKVRWYLPSKISS